MNISVEEIGQRQVILNIEVEPDEVEKSLEKAYWRLVNKTNVPGFRKGKAPRSTLERYLGRETLLDDALEGLVSETYRRAVEEKALDTVGQPRIEILEREPVSFKATVSLRPIVELGDYHQLSFTPEPVPEQDVGAAIEQLRLANTPWEPAERPAAFGDLVAFDVQGTVGEKSVLSQVGAQYRISSDSNSPVPGFAAQLIGMEKEQHKEFSLPFPTDHPAADLAGKECLFKVTLHEVKEQRLPELNDEFAKGIGGGFETMEALRKRVAADLKERAERQAMARLESNAVEALVGMSRVEYPPLFEEREVDSLIKDELESIQGNVRLADYLTRVGKTEDQLREELKPVAVKRVTRSLVLGKLAELEKIEVSSAEIDEEIDRIAKQAGERADRVKRALGSPGGRQSLENTLLTRKTLKCLVDIVTESIEDASSSAKKLKEA